MDDLRGVVNVLHVVHDTREAVKLRSAPVVQLLLLLLPPSAGQKQSLESHVATLALAVTLEELAVIQFHQDLLNSQHPVRVVGGQFSSQHKLALSVINLDAIIGSFPHLLRVVDVHPLTVGQVEQSLWSALYQTLDEARAS